MGKVKCHSCCRFDSNVCSSTVVASSVAGLNALGTLYDDMARLMNWGLAKGAAAVLPLLLRVEEEGVGVLSCALAAVCHRNRQAQHE